MRILVIILAVLGILWASPVSASIIKYVDDAGQMWYVNRIEAVPEQYRSQLSGKDVTLLGSSAKAGKQDPLNRYRSTFVVQEQAVEQQPKTIPKNVEFFVSDECLQCKIMESFLTSSKIRFSKYNIDQDSLAKSRFDRLGGTSVPFVKIGQTLMTGFNPKKILAELGL